jgi:hypothetical protein
VPVNTASHGPAQYPPSRQSHKPWYFGACPLGVGSLNFAIGARMVPMVGRVADARARQRSKVSADTILL